MLFVGNILFPLYICSVFIAHENIRKTNCVSLVSPRVWTHSCFSTRWGDGSPMAALELLQGRKGTLAPFDWGQMKVCTKGG